MVTEKRLIDANEAYEIARSSGLHDDFGRCMADLTSLKELLEDCPTVDAVEVVRCKDCAYCEKHKKWHGGKYFGCRRIPSEVHEVEPDHYCSFGERRTDNGC